MKILNNYVYIIFFSIAIIFSSCTKNKIEVSSDSEVNDFIWKGLNLYYLWQNEVPNLSDVRFLNTKEYNEFLSTEKNSSVFFDNLLYQKNIIDKWSWIVDDYIALEQAFQGTTQTNGMEFGLVRYKDNPANLFGYVRYVLPNTDAEVKGITRGMLFNQINGTQLTENNFRDLMFSTASYTIHFADYNGGNPTSNSTTISLSKEEYQENPIFINKTITSGSKKIGYLMYNSFTRDFDDELNAAFSSLSGENITDLIIDLRYNSGGSVRTAIYLSSMITGQFNGQLFAKQQWNPKVQAAINPNNLNNNFTNEIDNGIVKETINSLNLNSVYFITTNSSASASELVINGLNPYIDVKTVGTKTHGKYVGSVTLYDSENFTRNDVNPNHTWAMQPIVLEIVNKLGENDKDGFDPNVFLEEDYNNLGVLGNDTEPLLARTITYITTGSKGIQRSKRNYFSEIGNSKQATPMSNNMYVELE